MKIDLESYVGKIVDIVCNDDEKFDGYYVDNFTDYYDNDEREEDSIDILRQKGDKDGIILYASEIKSITETE